MGHTKNTGNQTPEDLQVNLPTRDFIRLHRNDDVRILAFSAGKNPEVDVPFALDQIKGWQTARHKLPSWASTESIIYPPHLNMEQCSSEQTARYKQKVLASYYLGDDAADCACQSSHVKLTDKTVGEGAAWTVDGVLMDLTGGFGVDFSFLSRCFTKSVYVERNASLCRIARHNFDLMGLSKVEVVNSDGIDLLKELSADKTFLMTNDGSRLPLFIYLDPARRDVNGKKVYNIADCEPDVVSLLPLLLSMADKVMIKLSPMFDWREAVRELPGVSDVHIVSVRNECKELLVVLSGKPDELRKNGFRIHCVNDDDDFTFVFGGEETSLLGECQGSIDGSVLLVPNASVMKAGCFSELALRFGVSAISVNSHLFLSSHTLENFPGRQFCVVAVSSMNKKELKRNLAGITKANIAVRNFPMTVDALRRRLKIKDGGDIYIFATTVSNDSHVLIITKKIV